MPTQGPPQTDRAERALTERGIEVFSSITEAENTAYGAQLLHTSIGTIRVRQGRVTPTKPGVFIAVWRRLESGETGPFPDDGGIDYLLVTVQKGELAGSFLIPSQTLVEHQIVSVEGKGGKRGFRLYPTWLTKLNPQATQSQAWQAPYFQTRGGTDRRCTNDFRR